jgi:Uma2 family endonuclease
MATAPTLPLVSVEEYLRSSWRPDKEFVDGVLIDKGMPTVFHQMLSAILLRWFYQYEKEFRIKALADVRTQIIERARYRLPDLLIFTVPARLGRILTVVPDIVIEILSPDDRQSDNLARFRDYENLGVSHIVQMDPEEHVAHRYQGGSLIQTEFRALSLSGRPDLPFDSAALFEQLRQEVADADLADDSGTEINTP